MSRFRNFIEQHDDQKENAVRELYEKATKALLGSKHPKESIGDSITDFGGGQKVLGILQQSGVFGENGMGRIPELRDNEIETKQWLGKAKPSADYTVGGLLKHMFGEEMASRLVAGKDAVDSAKAKVPPQPPVETQPQSKPNMQQPQAQAGPPQPPMPGGPQQNLPPAPMGVQQGLF